MVYVFDAVLQLDHAQEMLLTAHPVQSGANIATTPSEARPRLYGHRLSPMRWIPSWLGNGAARSRRVVNCYQTMLGLEQARYTGHRQTRLNTYYDMVITAIHTRDDNKTKHGLRATITFQQIFIGQVTTSTLTGARGRTTPAIHRRPHFTDTGPQRHRERLLRHSPAGGIANRNGRRKLVKQCHRSGS